MNAEQGFAWRKMELLAPAGDREALIAAVKNGADAVYFGGRMFNARRGAGNFDGDGMTSAVDYCHERGLRAYVTVNTLVKPNEADGLYELAAQLARAGADAAIVGELGVARWLRQWLPSLPLHASTQLAIHNVQGVREAAALGFERVVMAREMLDQEIALCAKENIEVEVFVHGALCSACSGQCLLSSLAGGRSGNRGMCAQPCRQLYALLHQGEAAREPHAYLLSTRDLHQIGRLDALRRAGVRSLKIEGRMRRPEYVAVVTRIYRDALDAMERGEAYPLEQAVHDLQQIYNRGGFTQGYGPGAVDSQIVDPTRPNHRGLEVGRIKGRVAVFSETVAAEDSVVYRLEGLKDVPIKLWGRAGEAVKLRAHAPDGASLFRLTQEEQMARARDTFNAEPQFVELTAKVKLHIGEPSVLEVTDGERTAAATGPAPERAERRGIDRESVAKQIEKTGGTPYSLALEAIDLDEGAYLSVKALNALRRDALLAMGRERIDARRGCDAALKPRREEQAAVPVERTALILQSPSLEVLRCAPRWGADEVCLDVKDVTEQGLRGLSNLLEEGDRFILALPPTLPSEDLDRLNQWAWRERAHITATLHANPGHFAMDWPGEARGDYLLNIANESSVQALDELNFQSFTASVELNTGELRALHQTSVLPMELLAYGRVPVMQLRHCPLHARMEPGQRHRACVRCAKQEVIGEYALADQKGHEFPMGRLRTGDGCIVRLYNSAPQMLLRKWGKIPRTHRIRLALTDEPMKLAEAIVKLHRIAIDGGDVRESALWPMVEGRSSTTGNTFRGVE